MSTEPVYTFANPSSQSLIDHPEDQHEAYYDMASGPHAFSSDPYDSTATMSEQPYYAAASVAVVDQLDYATASDPNDRIAVPSDEEQGVSYALADNAEIPSWNTDFNTDMPRRRSSTANSWDTMAARIRINTK